MQVRVTVSVRPLGWSASSALCDNCFLGQCPSQIFQSLRDYKYNLAWVLHFHCRFDNLDFFKVTGVSNT